MSQNTEFTYTEAFSRNLGWLGLSEQLQIKKSCIAIAGLGGVGGSHLLALVRMGFENFHIADLDEFDVANTNRQAGAMMSTLGKSKVSVMSSMAKDINPNVVIRPFDKGINSENLSDFLEGVDLVVDGLDLYAPKIRRQLFTQSYERRLPFVTAGPLGGGSAYLVFDQSSPHPDKYFNFNDDQSEMDMLIHFLVGLAPKALQAKYLVASEHVSPFDGKLCSLSAGAYMASGVVATKAMQIILNRNSVNAAPRYQQFDAYLNRYVSGRLRWGNRSWLQKLKIKLVRKAFIEMRKGYQSLNEACLDEASKKAA